MDLRHHLNQRYGLMALLLIGLFSYVFFSPNLDQYLLFAAINQGISHVSIFYLTYIGTNKIYAYFFIALLTYIICQWHLTHYVANKPLFIALSLAVTVLIVQCAGVFFSAYIEHIQLTAATGGITLVHNTKTSLPGAHIARLIALTTCFCMLLNRRWFQILIAAIAGLIVMGLGMAFYDRMFITNSLAGVLVGFFVPYYLKALLFIQHSQKVTNDVKRR